jgi:uncharacterized protein
VSGPVEPDLDAAEAWVRYTLETELPAYLTYHCATHTIDDVVPAAERLADAEGLSARDRTVLLTAAWFHDLGYIVRADGHEDIGIALAARELPARGYASEDIEAVATLIRATRLPQRPENHLAGLLADADLDVLGRDDFVVCNDALRSELAALGRHDDDAAWLDDQIAFLARHRYHTDTARALRAETKEHNLQRLRERRAALA